MHDVDLLLRDLPVHRCEALAEAMHALDRTVGIIRGIREEVPYLCVLTRDADPDAARRRAVELVGRAAERIGQPEAATPEVTRIAARRRLPGRPRRAATAPEGARAVEVGDGVVVRAVHEGPLGEWIVYEEADPGVVWRGRSLGGVLHELFELPHGGTPAWVRDAIRGLAGRETADGVRYACPCCDGWTLAGPPPGTYEICSVCWWEDDDVQFTDPSYAGGANGESLLEARDRFRSAGAGRR